MVKELSKLVQAQRDIVFPGCEGQSSAILKKKKKYNHYAWKIYSVICLFNQHITLINNFYF